MTRASLTRARRIQIAATGVLTVLALALVGWLLLRPATPEPPVTLTATSPTRATAVPEASVPGGAPVAFVGDGLDPAGAADGAGCAARSADGRTFADLLDQVTGDQTRVVVLLGSRNDLANPAAVGPGSQQAIRVAKAKAKAKAPQAQVVVVGPPALGDEGSAALTAAR